MKTNNTFNLKKEYKRLLASITDKHQRGEYLRYYIDAQLSYEQAKRQSIKTKEKE